MKTAAEAKTFIESMNARNREDIPEYLENVPPLYIFSLYWHPFSVSMGHMGTFLIPALDRTNPEQVKRGYSEPLIVPSMYPEEYDKLSGDIGLRFWDAFASKKNPVRAPGFVNDILGLHSSQPGLSAFTTNRSWFGVFVARGEGATKSEREKYREHEETWDFPTAVELANAKQKLTQMMQTLYRDAENKALQGPNGLKDIQPTEREAANWLGLNPSWCKRPDPMGECPECGQPIQPGLPVHFIQQGGCGAVLDEEKVRKNRTPGYEHIWMPKPAASAPPAKTT